MTAKPTQKKPPFVIEPLDWVAPQADCDAPVKLVEEPKQPAPAKAVRS